MFSNSSFRFADQAVQETSDTEHWPPVLLDGDDRSYWYNTEFLSRHFMIGCDVCSSVFVSVPVVESAITIPKPFAMIDCNNFV